MINILELESSKGWGGQEKRTARLVNSLDKNRFKIFWVVQPQSELLKHKNEIDAQFFEISMKKSYNIFTIIKLIKIIKDKNIDIIATHSGKDGWLGAIAGFLTKTKVVRVRHLQTPIKSPFSYNLSSHIVGVSKQVAGYLQSRGVKKNKISVIYTGVDTQKFSPSQKIDIKNELNLPKDTIVIAIVAVLRNAKRHIDLIEAFCRLKTDKNIALAIIGLGPQENNIKKFIDEKGVGDGVFMLGHREDIDQFLPSVDIFVLPSSMEALGTAILEASSCGIPCIGTRVGGIPECIIDGKTGFLFEKENAEDLANKLQTLIDDENLRKYFGQNGRKFIEENFSISQMTEKTQGLYEEVLRQ